MTEYSKKEPAQRITFEDLRAENMRTLQNHYKVYNDKLDTLL